MKILRALPAIALAAGIVACNESNSIGSSIVEDKIEIVIDSSFSVSGQSVANPIIQSRTSYQLLGKIEAEGFGKLSTDFLTQLMPANMIDTVGVSENDLDSIGMRMFMNPTDYVGDSIVPMGLEIYKLDKGLTSPVFSNIDPSSYYNPANKLAETSYTASVIGLSDELINHYTNATQAGADSFLRVVDIKLPIELAKEFYRKYKKNPEVFNDPKLFSEWFPGLYVKNNFGSGRIMRFYASLMYMYYQKHDRIDDKDTVYPSANVIMSVSPEVVLGNSIKFDISDDLKALAASKPVIAAPTGYNVNINIPIREMVAKYKSHSNTYSIINTLKLNIPVEEIENNYDLTAPTDLLLVRKDKLEEFFAKTQINDNVSSFYASYNAATKSYDFSSLRQYFIDMTKKETITQADSEFVLVPVSAVYEQQGSGYTTETVIVALIPYTGVPAMAVLKLEDSRFDLTFSNQTM